jgi:hypothetical protein
MPAKTHAITGHEANCSAAADHFIACRGFKPATRIRARFDPIDQADATGLRAMSINPASSSSKALACYRDLSVLAIDAREGQA